MLLTKIALSYYNIYTEALWLTLKKKYGSSCTKDIL